jgi:toxin YoeB
VNLTFTPHGWDDYQYWQQTDRATLKRINRLIEDTLRSPYDGIGKPEALRHVLTGCWSRRIDEEHRLVYFIENQNLIILQARFHYE